MIGQPNEQPLLVIDLYMPFMIFIMVSPCYMFV